MNFIFIVPPPSIEIVYWLPNKKRIFYHVNIQKYTF